jgi:hypothetical protein
MAAAEGLCDVNHDGMGWPASPVLRLPGRPAKHPSEIVPASSQHDRLMEELSIEPAHRGAKASADRAIIRVNALRLAPSHKFDSFVSAASVVSVAFTKQRNNIA